MTPREQQILDLIRKDSMISQQAIATTMGVSRSAVAGHIMSLTNQGVIKGRGYIVDDAPFVALIGGINFDIHGKSDKVLRRQDSNPGIVHTSAGGVARNIAENLARLGANCRLISAVGNDRYGELLLQQCRDAGIDVQHVQRMSSAQTSIYLSVLDPSGNMQVAINDMAIIEKLGPDQMESCRQMLDRANLIVLDTNLRDDTLGWLANTFSGRPIIVDTVSATKARKIKPYLAAIHTLKANRDEAEALSGLSARTQADRRKLATWIHNKGVQRFFITLGKGGVFYSDGNTQGNEKPRTSRLALRNAGGAGDAFLAGIAYAALNDWPIVRSVHFGMAAADLTLSDNATTSSAMSIATINRVVEKQYADHVR